MQDIIILAAAAVVAIIVLVVLGHTKAKEPFLKSFFGKVANVGKRVYNGPPPDSVSYFADGDFQGRRTDVKVGQYSYLFDGMDNTFSSVIVPQGYKVVFFSEPEFQGVRGEFTRGNYPYVGDYWNDTISSLVVEKA
jgi:hypothetical protein